MKKVIRYSEAFKKKVVDEIGRGKFTSPCAAQKAYGIRGNTTVTKWIRIYGREDLLTDQYDPEVAADALARRLHPFLDENVGNPITLSDLEGHFHYSERHLNRIFRNQTSVTVQEFLHDKRLKTACDLLANTDLRTGEIAVRAGFENSSYFCKIFREHKHFTPKQYRTAHRK